MILIIRTKKSTYKVDASSYTLEQANKLNKSETILDIQFIKI